MDYYKLLHLEREPFSNSPDPEFFYKSRQHLACLQKLELALRLKRGLNVVVGDVGTGKTTLCRELIRRFAGEETFETHLLLDPSFPTTRQFLAALCAMLAGAVPGKVQSEIEIKEKIKQVLFAKSVEQNQVIIFIVDEGQKRAPANIEILRELHNFETNQSKLLQVVIFAQKEFNSVLQKQPNFADRINLLHYLEPMGFRDTRNMIRFRLNLASQGARANVLFTLPAYWQIYRASRGYPRKIINLCHQSILALIIQNRHRADWRLINSCRKRIAPVRDRRGSFYILAAMAAIAAGLLLAMSKTPRGAVDFVKPKASGTAVSVATGKIVTAPGAMNWQKQTDGTQSSPPLTLGRLTMEPGDALANLSRQVYGKDDHEFLQALIAANPHIQTPEDARAGVIIEFPVVEFKSRNNADSCHWLIVEQRRTLAEALEGLRTLNVHLKYPLKIVPVWTPEEGLHFKLAASHCFRSQESAYDHLSRLPIAIFNDPQGISGWGEGARLYAAF